MMQPIPHVLLFLLQGFMTILVAPLISGWIKIVKCWLQNRSGPSLFQPYYAFYKLLIKEPVLAENASWLFRFAPYLYFSCLAAIGFGLPLYTTETFSLHNLDMIIVVGLLALARVSLVLAGMDVGTAFGHLGSRREMLISCLAEPILLIIFFNVALLSHFPSIDASSAYFLQHSMLHLYPSLAFSLVALVLVAIAETGRVPIDNPATHLELTMVHEAMILEYSGRYLALIEWGNSLKLTLYLGFIAAIFIPYGLSATGHWVASFIGLLTTLIKFFLLAALIGLIESINSKLRLFKVPDYLVSAFVLAVVGVLLTQLVGSY